MITARPDAEIIGATPADLDLLSQVIAAAFHDLAPSRWLIAEPAARRTIFPGYFRLLIAHAMAAGLVHTTPARDAVALWLPAGPGVPGPLAGYQQRLNTATAPWTGRFAVFDQALAAHHPAGVPHQHLAILAVRPGRHGLGIGSALLNARHHDLDHNGTPAYLEATSPRARDLYLWHGYTTRPGAAFRLPEGPLVWPMWREPVGTHERRRWAGTGNSVSDVVPPGQGWHVLCIVICVTSGLAPYQPCVKPRASRSRSRPSSGPRSARVARKSGGRRAARRV